MIDLHCHFIPRIDDGPANLPQALELCRIASADGITHAITTPHIHPQRWDNTIVTIEEGLMHLRRALLEEGIALQVGYAAEVRLSDEVPAQVEAGQIPFYGSVEGQRLMLLEFPHSHIPPGSDKLVAWLRQRQIRPLIAHPERNRQVMRNCALMQPFIEMGCWLQVTAGAVLGDFGAGAQAAAAHFLDTDTVHVVASDGHNERARAPRLRSASEYVARVYGIERSMRLFRDTPALVIAGQFPELTTSGCSQSA